MARFDPRPGSDRARARSLAPLRALWPFLKPYRLQMAGAALCLTVHYLAIKALAVHDDEFCRIFIDHIPFETSLGTMTVRQLRDQSPQVRYAPTVGLDDGSDIKPPPSVPSTHSSALSPSHLPDPESRYPIFVGCTPARRQSCASTPTRRSRRSLSTKTHSISRGRVRTASSIG